MQLQFHIETLLMKLTVVSARAKDYLTKPPISYKFFWETVQDILRLLWKVLFPWFLVQSIYVYQTPSVYRQEIYFVCYICIQSFTEYVYSFRRNLVEFLVYFMYKTK